MKRNLIIIGGGYLQIPLIKTAADMGLSTIVFDMSKDAPGMDIAERAVVVSSRDVEGSVREAKALQETMDLHGVVTAATDASRTVAAIAAALYLPGIRYADAEAATNKVLMRRRLQAAGLPVPDFFSVWSLPETREAVDRLQPPVVLKPAENMGSRGVIKIADRREVLSAYRHCRKYSQTGEMILEQYMPGPELSIDALAWEGNIQISGIADRIIAGEPFFIESGHNMPTKQSSKVVEDAAEVMRAGMRSLGIHTGAGKGDIKITPEGVKIGEIAARISGGFMSSHTYPLHCGIDLMRAVIKIALGERPEGLRPVFQRVAIERGISGRRGKILDIGGREEMLQVAGIEHIYIKRSAGDILPQASSNLDKVGHIVAVGDSLEEAERAVAKALQKLRLEIDESYGIDWPKVEQRARERFGDSVCWVCRSCDGSHCASGVPGMGGVGMMNSFRDNSLALAEVKLLPRYIRKDVRPDSSLEIFGHRFEHPIMAAPMTGALTNMNGAAEEYDLAHTLLSACRESGTIGWVGDGASPEKYLTIIRALEAVEGFGIAIFKPRADSEALARRFRAAERAGLVAIGMDIDAVSFKTMRLRGEAAVARDRDLLCQLRDSSPLPFILKGIMTPEDAQLALEAGMDAIVVSNHGGRVLDDMPGTARVLPAIAAAVGGRLPVLVDGGIRSGRDVFKMLALGAEAVLIGRPAAIAAVGGGVAAVKSLFLRYAAELREAMEICGAASLEDIDRNYCMSSAPPPPRPLSAPSAFLR